MSRWVLIASMNYCRQNSACTVFKGKIVMTGGYDGANDTELRSVEAYYYYENKWDFLPRMINKRTQHGAVCNGNKLFVINGMNNVTCEVFDSISMKFTSIKHLDCSFDCVTAVSIGDKILTICSSFGEVKERILTYNVDKNEWYYTSTKSFGFDRILRVSKLPVN